MSDQSRDVGQLIARLVDLVEEISRRTGGDELELGRLHNIRVDALRSR